MPPHYVNCAHFCGGRVNFEFAVESLVMRFYRDHQVAHEYSNRAASNLQNTFISDRDGDVSAALSSYNECKRMLESTIQQWDLTLASNLALQAYLPDKLRSEFVQLMTAPEDKLIDVLQASGNSPGGLVHPFNEVVSILKGGSESSVINLFQVNGSKIEGLRDLCKKILEELLKLEPYVYQGRLWDEVVPKSFLVDKRKHPLIDLDEKYFAAMMSHAFYLEAISQLSREALLRSSIPYEECSSKRKTGGILSHLKSKEDVLRALSSDVKALGLSVKFEDLRKEGDTIKGAVVIKWEEQIGGKTIVLLDERIPFTFAGRLEIFNKDIEILFGVTVNVAVEAYFDPPNRVCVLGRAKWFGGSIDTQPYCGSL